MIFVFLYNLFKAVDAGRMLSSRLRDMSNDDLLWMGTNSSWTEMSGLSTTLQSLPVTVRTKLTLLLSTC